MTQVKGEDHYQCREVKAERDALKAQVADLTADLDAQLAQAMELVKTREAENKALRRDCKFLLSWAPDDCRKHVDPTSYFTLSYEGDLKLQTRVDRIRAALDKLKAGE